MMLLKSFFRRIIKDFRHKELLPLKLIFFVQASTLYVLYPYLTIHMRELGINVEETAIMSAVTPLVAMVMPPLAGMVADRIGNFRILLSIFSTLGGAAALLLLLVPIGRVTVQFPERVVMDLSCPGKNGELIYTMQQEHPCETELQSVVNTRIESCGYSCNMLGTDEMDLQTLLTSRVYTVRHFNLDTGENSSYKYTISQNELPRNIGEKQDMREYRKLKNNEYFKTSIRPLSNNFYYFPTNQLFEYSCTFSGFVEDFESVTSVSEPTVERVYENRTLCTFGQIIVPAKNNSSSAINYHSYKTKLKFLTPEEADTNENRQRYLSKETAWTGWQYQKTVCSNPDLRNHQVILHVPLFNYTLSPEPYRTLSMEGCSKRCIVTAPREDMCSNKDMEIEYNIRLTFWLYLIIRVFIGIIGGTTFAMFEGAVIAILREQKADYGLQRIYGSIGGMISSPLSGLLIDHASFNKGYTDFRPAFYLYAALKIVSGALMLGINLEFKAPAGNVVNDVVNVLKNVEMSALFIACFILGTAWGYIESFLFWLIQDLGGSRSLMGITITVGGIAGIPLLVLSGPIVSKIGHANVLFIGFIFYAIRLFGYSLIYNPWLTLIFEALESVTSSLSFTAAVTYAAKLSTTSTDSSIQGLLGGVYYGVGKGSGSLIGGYLMKGFGTRPTYQIFAVICLITGVIYFLFNMLYLKKRPQVEGNDIVKKKPKNQSTQNGLENGIVEIKLDEKKGMACETETNPEKASIDRKGIDNEAFTMDQESKEISNDLQNEDLQNEASKNSKNIEAINNVRNLDRIEKMHSTEDKNAKGTLTKKLGEKSDQQICDKENTRRNNGMVNLNCDENEEQKCDVTIEKEPDRRM